MTSSLPVTMCMHADTGAFVFIPNVRQIKSTYVNFTMLLSWYHSDKRGLFGKQAAEKVVFNKTIIQGRGNRIGSANMHQQKTVTCTAENTFEVITVKA